MPAFRRIAAVLLAALSGGAIGYDAVDRLGASESAPGGTGGLAARSLDPAAGPPRIFVPDDTLAFAVARPGIVGAERPARPRSAWTLRSEPSGFADVLNVYLSVPSDAPLACGARRRASLMLRCLEDRTAIYIAHDCATPAIDPDGWQVDLRLDDGAAETRWMQVDSRGEAFGHWDYRDARTLMETLLEGETLHVRFDDIEGRRSAMRFPLDGLDAALPDLTRACHWSDVPPWQDATEVSVNGSGPESGPGDG
ncbi:type VI secretion system-associated protein TagO [Jannaschia marina]|uniref:type VI secretion system-associated protein TagO n=1 Tax=Jannaschia marina TaxID=2741674 RepID=UPI0015CD59B8|nr:type VI secretion system-associated protein TagO [Jannaschia marina]